MFELENIQDYFNLEEEQREFRQEKAKIKKELREKEKKLKKREEDVEKKHKQNQAYAELIRKDLLKPAIQKQIQEKEKEEYYNNMFNSK